MNPDVLLKDPLTGAYSRAILQHRLKEEVERALRYQESFSILMLDLDHFKSVNDAFGHKRGDQLLIELVERLHDMVRAADILIRYGGDEFVMLLPKTSKQQGIALAQRLLDEISATPFPGDPPLSLGISIGVASYPEDGETPESLFDEADLRQNYAKRRGRGNVVSEDPGKPALLPFEEVSRLAERDEALAAVQDFYQKLVEARRGTLFVNGCQGSGRSRFLVEVAKAGRLLGYEVVSMKSSAALGTRVFGVLNKGFEDWELPSPLAGPAEFGQALQAVVQRRGRSGLLIIADDIPNFDWATLELFQHLFVSDMTIRLALAYSSDPENSQRLFLPEAPLAQVIELYPLSNDGMRIWLRSVMQWELPSDFSDWLYSISEGRPGYVERCLTFLVDWGILKQSAPGWDVRPNFREITIQEGVSIKPQAPPNNLPVQPTYFLGRDQEIQLVKELLKEKRLITLCGPGGMGKTRLALQVAAEVLDQFTQGVFLVPLAPISSPDFIISTIAGSLKFSFYSITEDPKQQLINYLREKQLLLVMDNFEHIIQGCGVVAELLEAAPRLKILVTSRERLNLKGESILELKGMRFPKEGAEADGEADGDYTAGMEIYASVQLFLMHARQVQSDFILTDEDRPHIARICQLVEGLPLGIELAAAWVRLLSCKEIAEEIERSLDFLASEMRDLPDRHRSLRAVFEQSWILLTDEERVTFARLSVFPAGFRREAAAFVGLASLPVLSSLVNKSLLYKISTSRFVIHENLRQYASEKLALTPTEHQNAQEKLCEYYAGFLEQKKELMKRKQKESLDEIQLELDGIRLAWSTAIDYGQASNIDKMLPALGLFYEMRGLTLEGQSAIARATHKVRSIVSALPAGQAKVEDELLLGRLILWEGVFLFRQSMHKKAKSLDEKSLEIFRRLDSKPDLASLLWRMSAVHEHLGEYPQARQTVDESLALFRQAGDTYEITRAMNEAGILFYSLGDYEQAKAVLSESIDICVETQNQWGLSHAYTNLGNIFGELGEFDKAEEKYRQSLAISREIGDKISTAVLLNNLGDTAMKCGRYGEAKKLLKESCRSYEEIGDLYGMSTPLGNLGFIAQKEGKFARSKEYYQQSLSASRNSGNQVEEAYTLGHLGVVANLMGDLDEACQYYHMALETALALSSTPLMLEVLGAVSEYLAMHGHPERAFAYSTYIFNHLANTQEARDRAELLLKKLRPTLPAEEISTALKMGKNIQLAQTIQELLKEI